MKFVGIDLSGKDGNPTGVALILKNRLVVLTEFRTLRGIMEYLYVLKPNVVAIDSPLSLPEKGAYRDCDLELKKLGLNPLPLNMWSMKMLIERALKLVAFVNKMRIRAIETFPYGSLRLLGYGRKPRNKRQRAKILREIARIYGIKISVDTASITKDQFDAFICATTAHATTNNKKHITIGKKCKIHLLTR